MSQRYIDRIRNFSIIAHIDHGKSSLADRFLQIVSALSDREQKDRFLDNMDLERERGITIKAQTVRLSFLSQDGLSYQINLIDTPGHVDFSYEVSRSLSACEGALLVVDAAQGMEAQTIAHALPAIEADLKIIPLINKIDLPTHRVDEVKEQLKSFIGFKDEEILLASAKENIGIRQALEAVVERVPPPSGDPALPLQALIFDSWFDSYQGVTALCRVRQGCLKKGDPIHLKGTNREAEILKLGAFSPFAVELPELRAGEVGFVITGIKEIADMRVGDTIVHSEDKKTPALEGFKKARPMVYSGFFPISSDDFGRLKKALSKLSLNDSSLSFEVESSAALGFGFRCGFLGLLHREIVQERLKREFDLDLVGTIPSVVYRIHLKNKGEVVEAENPSLFPNPSEIDFMEEPMAEVKIHSPAQYIGPVIQLCVEKRGRQKHLEYISGGQAILTFIIPLNEMILDFHDRLKSLSKGYASMDYEPSGYERSVLVKTDILLNGEAVDSLSIITHRSQAEKKGRLLAKKLKKLIPRQQFQVAIQAVIGAKVIARETISAYRKDVTAKLYGGDVTRKKKLLEKQKKGKKKMKLIGRVEVPQKAFTALLSSED